MRPSRSVAGAAAVVALAVGCGSSAAQSALASSVAPSSRFALAGMSLTLPVDARGDPARLAAQVTGKQLAAGFHDDWFHLDADGRLVLTAPADGATTTPGVGSDHVRSELREHYIGPGTVGDDCWTSQLGGTLDAVVQVQAIPRKVGEITIGQVHGQGGDAFVLLAYRSDHELTVSIYPEPGAAASVETVLEGGVQEGHPITYALAFVAGVVSVTVDGQERSFREPAWAAYPVHFALGAYSAAPDAGNPRGSGSQVAVTSFHIAH